MRKRDSKIDKLWADYYRSGSAVARNALTEKYLKIVTHVATKMKARLPHHVELDDLVHMGVFGLFEAIRRFDPGRDVKFETYCGARIRGSILDGLRKQDWVPRLTRRRASRLSAAQRKLEGKLLRPPNDAELAAELHITLQDLNDLLGEVGPALSFTAHRRVLERDDAGLSIEDIWDKNTTDPAKEIGVRDMMRVLLSKIRPRERYVLVMYLFEDMTLKEIGWVLGLSESRACQIANRLFLRLRNLIRRKTKVLGQTA